MLSVLKIVHIFAKIMNTMNELHITTATKEQYCSECLLYVMAEKRLLMKLNQHKTQPFLTAR